MKIDVADVIKSKNPDLLRIIPNFLINWVKKLIHQDELNELLLESGHLKGTQFATASLNKFNITYNIHGLERLNKDKRYIIVSNHPLGGLDGIIMIELFGKIFKEIKFVVNDLLYHIEPLQPVFIPINKYGRQSSETAQMIKESYESNAQILYFPAGLCSRLTNGKIEDLEWKRSYINQAIKYKRDILPVYFEGRNTGLFYRVANLRKKMGMKFNYETILLPREMFKKRGTQFNVYIGQPVTYEQLSTEGTVSNWNSTIRKQVYSIKKQLWNQ
ncbi:MAG: 1-acyl-sn-glycerol-3-phosphate acyltransferase [Bacteroidales bacterium]